MSLHTKLIHVGELKPFFNKTGNRFVETGCLPVIGLCDVMSRGCSPQKEAF